MTREERITELAEHAATVLKTVATGVGDLEYILSGGSAGQVLAKASGTDRDFEWVDAGGGGGGAFFVNTATLTNDTTGSTLTPIFTLPITATKKYLAKVIVYFESAAGTTGIRVGMKWVSGSGLSTAKISGIATGPITTAAAATALQVPMFQDIGNNFGGQFVNVLVTTASTGQVGVVTMDFLVDCLVTGTFDIVFASEVAGSMITVPANRSVLYLQEF